MNNEIKYKTCSNCNKSKQLTDYYVDERLPDGRKYLCKVCYRERVRLHYWSQPNIERERSRKYYRNNTEASRERGRNYYRNVGKAKRKLAKDVCKENVKQLSKSTSTFADSVRQLLTNILSIFKGRKS